MGEGLEVKLVGDGRRRIQGLNSELDDRVIHNSSFDPKSPNPVWQQQYQSVGPDQNL